MKQKGGILLPNKNEKETFMAYLDNSDIDFLSKGSYGLTLKTGIIYNIPVKPKKEEKPKEEDGTLFPISIGGGDEDETMFHSVSSGKGNDSNDSFHSVPSEDEFIKNWEVRLSKTTNTHYYANLLNGFSTFDVPKEIEDNPKCLPKINFYKKISPDNTFGKPVTNLVIKIVLICDTNKRFQISKKDALHTVLEDDFKNEINIQTDIFFKTITYLQPLCPGIVYSEIVKNKSDIRNFLTTIFNRCDSELMPVINEINKICATNPDVSFGIIGMECAERYSMIGQAVNNFRGSPSHVATLRALGQFALLKLATDTGYSHNDFHNSNILLCESHNYLNEGQIMPLLIDFGRAVKIPLDILAKIKEHIASKNYIDALSLLCDKSYAHEFLTSLEHVDSHYGWVCGDYNLSSKDYIEKINKGLKSLNDDITRYNYNQPFDKMVPLKSMPGYMRKYPKPQKLNPQINNLIDQIYSKREIAIDNNIKIMNELHNKDNKYPLIPIADSIKGQLYKGLIGGKRKKNPKTRKNKNSRKFTRKFRGKK